LELFFLLSFLNPLVHIQSNMDLPIFLMMPFLLVPSFSMLLSWVQPFWLKP